MVLLYVLIIKKAKAAVVANNVDRLSHVLRDSTYNDQQQEESSKKAYTLSAAREYICIQRRINTDEKGCYIPFYRQERTEAQDL